MLIFDTNKIKDNEIRQKIKNNAFVMTSILLLKNIFKDIDEWRPLVKSIIELDDDRKIMLFEYIVTKQDITEEKFNDLITEIKGDEMPSLAEIWMERGVLKEIRDSIKRGLELKFKQLGKNLFLVTQKIQEIDKLKEIQDALYVINDADEFKRFVQKRV